MWDIATQKLRHNLQHPVRHDRREGEEEGEEERVGEREGRDGGREGGEEGGEGWRERGWGRGRDGGERVGKREGREGWAKSPHECLLPLFPSQAGVTQLYCSKVNPLVFTSCLDGAVRLWDVRGGECVREWWGHTKDILSLAVARYVYMYNVVSISRISVLVDRFSMVQLVIFLNLASSLPPVMIV